MLATHRSKDIAFHYYKLYTRHTGSIVSTWYYLADIFGRQQAAECFTQQDDHVMERDSLFLSLKDLPSRMEMWAVLTYIAGSIILALTVSPG